MIRKMSKDFPLVESAVLAPQIEVVGKQDPKAILQSLLSEDKISRRIHSTTYQIMELFSDLQHGQWGVGLYLQKSSINKKSFFKRFENKEYNDVYLLQMACFIESVNRITHDTYVESF